MPPLIRIKRLGNPSVNQPLRPLVLGVDARVATTLLERLKAPAPIGWFLMLGNQSYAIYLVHDPIVSMAARLSIGLDSS